VTALHDLRGRVAGEVAGPGEDAYEAGRAVFNARVDRRPAAIVRCHGTADAAAAVSFAAEAGIPVAVRGGGMSDRAVVDGGLVIDVSPLKDVQVDAPGRRARLGGGLTWAELDAATLEHGLAVTGGRISGLGVAGVALDGGSGWLERAFGPTCASLASAEVVLAGGRAVVAAEGEHPDLLWALRGGRPAVGVVTRLELELRPLRPVLLAGFLTFPRSRAREVARSFRDLMEQAPDEVGGGLSLFAGRGGACRVAFCHIGSPEDGARALAPLRALRPSLDAVQANEYRAFQAMTDLQHPFGMRGRRSSGFLAELSDDCVDAALAAADAPAAALSHVLLRPLGGALGRADRAAMALDLPDARWAYECLSLWPPVPALDRGNIAWTERVEAALAPHAAAGPPGTEAAAERQARLDRARARYDPEGIFARGADG
jgi:FAD/FMN-containing dehydrogenase